MRRTSVAKTGYSKTESLSFPASIDLCYCRNVVQVLSRSLMTTGSRLARRLSTRPCKFWLSRQLLFIFGEAIVKSRSTAASGLNAFPSAVSDHLTICIRRQRVSFMTEEGVTRFISSVRILIAKRMTNNSLRILAVHRDVCRYIGSHSIRDS